MVALGTLPGGAVEVPATKMVRTPAVFASLGDCMWFRGVASAGSPGESLFSSLLLSPFSFLRLWHLPLSLLFCFMQKWLPGRWIREYRGAGVFRDAARLILRGA